MSRNFRLSSLLRARQVQEDVAKSAVSRASTAKETARRAAAAGEAALRATSPPPAGTANAVVAAIAAQRAMAAGLAAAWQVAQASDEHHAERLDELAVAATRRRAVERLAERHAEDVQRADLAAEQRAIDEIAARYPIEVGGLG
jgi:flagellar protein FliJ